MTVSIKPLEWNDDPCPAAKCVFGHYVVNKNYADVELLVGYGRASATGIGRITLEVGATEADLKAAAQADYEARIRSALTAQVQDVQPVCCGRPVHEGSPEAYTLECCGNFVKPATLSAQVQDVAVPDGWQLVPKEPTKRMLKELCLIDGFSDRALKQRYRDMLAAAPAKQEGKP